MTSVHVVYRAAPGGNRKRRPPWFSKALCLASIIRAAENLPGTSFSFLCDGTMAVEVEQVMRRFGELQQLGGVGNAGSYRAAVDYAAALDVDPSSIIYMCEDDYLHLPDALSGLQKLSAVLPDHGYATLYDHPDRSRRSDDLPPRATTPLAAHNVEWVPVESTTMTFATRPATLRRDRRVHKLAALHGYPRDRALWRLLQGLGWRRWVLGPRSPRALYCARPGLSAHAEVDVLPPGDWATAARETADWARPRDLLARAEW
jgi:hypothetical protein